MQKEAQKGHSNIPSDIHRCRRLLTRALRFRRLHCKLIAVRNLLGILISIRNLNHGENLLRTRTGVGSHCLGIHGDVDVVAILNPGLELNRDIGKIGSTTLICLLNHQHY